MANELVVINKIPKVPASWNYDESVKRIKAVVYKWKELTIELATELYIAREALSVPHSHESRWVDYCNEIGVDKRVANRWLQRFFIGQKSHETLKSPKIPHGVFNVIYADPPWQYSNSGFAESANKQYPTMSNEEIYDLIEKLNPHIENEAVLFLWVTAPFLWVGHQVCEAWSFDYKTNMVWVKNKGPSIGWFTQSRHEHLFIATRGDGMHPKYRPISYFEADAGKHSEKPSLVYNLIERMYPKQKYLELFARNKRPGWESWGNELQ